MTRILLLLVLAGGLVTGCAPSPRADWILLHNATIYTVDPANPTAEAMLFNDDGEILAVGNFEQLMLRFSGATPLDGRGATVVPGFIDAHGHLMGLGYALQQVDLTGTTAESEVIARLQQAADDQPDGWLIGRGWDQNDWADTRFPTRDRLDQAFPERPVWLTRVDGHAGWANSAAMRAGDRNLDGDWQPEGGQIVRDPTGRATGVFVDAAMGLIDAHKPGPSAQATQRALDAALAEMSRHGVTGVHDAGTSLEQWRLYQARAKDGRLPLRIYAMANGEGSALDFLCAEGVQSEPTGRLDFRAVKFYADGALGSRGAALFRPYADDPGNRGLLIQPAARLAEAVDRAMGCGLQVNTHAIGIRGAAVVIQAYELGLQKNIEDVGRHRIEHAQVMSLSQLPEMRRLNLIASVQPTHATSDMPWAEDRLGPVRIRGAYAWQRFLDAGVRLALGSDFPVESPNPILGFYAAVTRQDLEGYPSGGWFPDQRLTREQALRGFTLDAAYAGFAESRVGSLEPGKQADFVMLSADIMKIPPAAIPATRVIATYLDGELVWSAEESRAAD